MLLLLRTAGLPWSADTTFVTADSAIYTADGYATYTPPVPPSPSTDVFSGGFLYEYERGFQRRLREQRELDDAEAATREIANEIDREIAQLLHAQEQRDLERRELERLSRLVTEYTDAQAADALNERVQKAFLRAQVQLSTSALLALDREVQRQMEEEEFAVLMTAALID
jgi:hypothetical protein